MHFSLLILLFIFVLLSEVEHMCIISYYFYIYLDVFLTAEFYHYSNYNEENEYTSTMIMPSTTIEHVTLEKPTDKLDDYVVKLKTAETTTYVKKKTKPHVDSDDEYLKF